MPLLIPDGNIESFSLVKDLDGFERVVYGEVLLPDTPNTFGDFHTKRSVKEFAYGFMVSGFLLDLEHSENDVTGKISVVESFIARDNDPDFIPGAWVIGLLVSDPEVWGSIIDGDLTGFSYQAFTSFSDISLCVDRDSFFKGETEPDLFDGHKHNYFVIKDDNGRVLVGGTSYNDGHSHTISSNTFTDTSDGHIHIYNCVG